MCTDMPVVYNSCLQKKKKKKKKNGKTVVTMQNAFMA